MLAFTLSSTTEGQLIYRLLKEAEKYTQLLPDHSLQHIDSLSIHPETSKAAKRKLEPSSTPYRRPIDVLTMARPTTHQMTEWLQSRKIRTLSELCRIERFVMELEDEEEKRSVTAHLAAAWDSYVDSNQLLVELRGLTRNYPVSVGLQDEARRSVSDDANSIRSWNQAWLCLVKIRDENLVLACAQAEAQKPEMWGGRKPSEDEAEQLTQHFVYEWGQAVTNLLRHWEKEPVWY
ncbi:hypothetical protein GGS21DRAFT_491363 [Xylaria nigripes]|nr:hypothetical protein GGS21DRAFT_491363 [Xylaria nigripes]